MQEPLRKPECILKNPEIDRIPVELLSQKYLRANVAMQQCLHTPHMYTDEFPDSMPTLDSYGSPARYRTNDALFFIGM